MTNIFKLAFNVSRFRFWLYHGGTYLVGYIIGITDVIKLLDPFFLVQIFFFMIPANIFIYGVNDLSDRDTDLFNPKKDEKEYRAVEKDIKNLQIIVFLSAIYGLILLVLQPDLTASLMFAVWMLLAFLYSVKPIRLKTVPFLDFISNFFYAIPALLAYYQGAGVLPSFLPIFAAFLWTSAMQLFSAIPDIEADKKAHLMTTAVLIRRNASLILCFIFWMGFATILVFIVQWNAPWNLLTFVYPAIPFLLLIKPTINIDRTYWLFPYWTGLFGMILFFSVGIPKLQLSLGL